jgi:RND family efflux transporter MFP subunit
MTDTFSHIARHVRSHVISSRKLTHWIIVCIFFFIFLSLNGCGEKTSKKGVLTRPVRTVVAPQPSFSTSFIQTGEIRAHDEITLGFRLDGRLLERRVEVGDSVSEGQLLASLGSETSENQLSSTRADLVSARVAEQMAATNLRRMKALMPKGAISRVQLDNAISEWQSAASHLQTSENSLKNAQNNLSWSRLTSPASGVITQVSASAGQVVSAGQTIVTLAESNRKDAVFDLSEAQAGALKSSAIFNVSLLSEPSVQVPGVVRDLSPQSDPQTRTWRVRVALDNPPPAMILGASVLGQLPETGQRTIRLPASALTEADGHPAVFVVNMKTLRLERRKVVIGKFSVSDIYLISGVAPGDTVVTAGVSKLREGELVSPGEVAE